MNEKDNDVLVPYNARIAKETLDWDKNKGYMSRDEEIQRKLSITGSTRDRKILEDELKRLRDREDWSHRHQYIVTPAGGVVDTRAPANQRVVVPNNVESKSGNDALILDPGQRALLPDGSWVEGNTILNEDQQLVGGNGVNVGPRFRPIVLDQDNFVYDINSGSVKGTPFSRFREVSADSILVDNAGKEVAENRKRVVSGDGQNFVWNQKTKTYDLVDKFASNGNGVIHNVNTGAPGDNKDAIKVVELQNKGGSNTGTRYEKLGNGWYYDREARRQISVPPEIDIFAKKIVDLEELISLSNDQKTKKKYQAEVDRLKQEQANYIKQGIGAFSGEKSSGQNGVDGFSDQVYVPKK